MREIVDKHFPDNWVVSYYLGFVVDLSIAWEGYRAAKAALSNTIQVFRIYRFITIDSQCNPLKGVVLVKSRCCFKATRPISNSRTNLITFILMNKGVLVEEFVLDNLYKLLATFREANVVIKWLMLHTNTQDKKLKQTLTQDINYGNK